MYVDAHIADIVEPNNQCMDIKNTVWNNLWLVIKALAIKKRMFQKFEDYDGYAFYSATRIYNALRKNYVNQGKTIKGKEIRPIKSCLNYIKALMYPMKVEYQNETFSMIISEEMTAKQFDSALFTRNLKSKAQEQQNGIMYSYLRNLLETSPILIDQVLEKSPFTKGSDEYKKIRISILLNSIKSLKVKHKLEWDPVTIILWKLPRTLSGYVRVLLKEFYTLFKQELLECIALETIPDNILDKVISPNSEDKSYYEE